MRETPVCTAADAIYKLAAGNLKYLNAENGSGDISRRIRMSTWAKGQSPYAIIVTCSDSRVIPENIFSEGIELLIHIGIDTIALRGSGFTPLVREGQAVKAGTPLLNVDLDAIRAAGLSTESAVIVTNADDLPKLHIIAGGIVSTGTPLFKFE